MKKKKKTGSKPHIFESRLQSLIRNPQYLKEKAELGKAGPEQIEDFYQKYRIHAPVNSPNMFTDFTVRIIPAGYMKILPPDKNNPEYRHDYSPMLKDRRYLTVEIDLSRGKTHIEKSIREYIAIFSPYVEKPDTRVRESDRMYQVWDEYKLLHSFSKVSKKLKIKESTARKTYYRAFALIMGETYDSTKHNKESLTKEQLAKTCETCLEYTSCQDLCPDVLAFVSQDEVKLREKLRQ